MMTMESFLHNVIYLTHRFFHTHLHTLPELKMKCSCIAVSRWALTIHLSSKEYCTSAPASWTPQSADSGKVTVENRPMKEHV